MSKEIEVTFKLRVKNDRQFKDVVVVMTAAANTFFRLHRKEGDDVAVMDHQNKGPQPHPLDLSKKGNEFCQKLKEFL